MTTAASTSTDGQATRVKVAVAGLGHWGKNLVRNFDDLAELRALCDVSPETREEFARRYTNANVTDDFDELLSDPEVEAVVIATPVPTHYSFAKQALQAGKHVFVEKPPAMRGEEMEELVALAEERELTLMPGHLLLYHPGARRSSSTKAYSATCSASTATARTSAWTAQGRERALVTRRSRPLRDPVPPRRGAERGLGARQCVLDAGCRGRRLLLPPLPERQDRAMHLSWLDPHKMRRITVVGRDKMVVFDDMELERKITVYEKGPWQPARTYGEWQTRTGDIYSPEIPTTSRSSSSASTPLTRPGRGRPPQGRARRARSRAHARAAAALSHGRTRVNYELGANAVVIRDGDRRRLQDR